MSTGATAEQLVHLMRPGTLSLASLPPLSLYVHLPWCLRKCPYCDFNSHEVGKVAKGTPGAAGAASATGATGAKLASHSGPALDEAVQGSYIDALIADLDASLPLVWGRPVHTVFIGGGTPSLFAPAAIDRLLGAVRARLPLVPGAEVTLEANPGTFERDRFAAFRAAGVTRLSIGVQSFDDALLARIGRVHDGAQARAALAEAAASFETFNIDLMYALPGQTPEQLQSDLDTALSYAPPHLSIYHLTIEPNTAFAVQPPADLPDPDLASDMLDVISARAAGGGLERYEVSAYARAGHRSRHNLNYWQFGDYLGIGAGAHGKLSFAHRIVRQVRWREPVRYVEQALAGEAVSNQHEVTRADLPFEFMVNALRLAEGCELAHFVERTGLPRSAVEPALQEAERRGLLVRRGDHIAASTRGFDFLNDLQALFLPPAGRSRPPPDTAPIATMTRAR
jgi:oxygen-independent coproporphyrinogen-3 oxidase